MLEVRVCGVEGIVVPVEPAGALGSPRQHRDEYRAEEGVVGRLGQTRVRAGEDRGGRLALEVVDRIARIGQASQRRRLLFDETPHERPVLVERRPVTRHVLLERERHLCAPFGRERGEAKRAQRFVEVRSAEQSHGVQLRAGGLPPTWQPLHQ